MPKEKISISDELPFGCWLAIAIPAFVFMAYMLYAAWDMNSQCAEKGRTYLFREGKCLNIDTIPLNRN